jgi:fructose-1,6-bisphosphatase I
VYIEKITSSKREIAMTELITIERHILEHQERFPDASGKFTNLLYDIALAAKIISRETNRAGLADIIGATEGENVYGERQQKLDMFADDMLVKLTSHTGRLCALVSEEQENIVTIPDEYESGNYVLLFDPLDGSSNIDVNVSIGTIFGIHQKISEGRKGTLGDALQPGNKLVAAGYIIYGSSTMMVYSTGDGVHGFTLETSVGEFLLSHPNMRMPQNPKYYSVNHGYEKNWTPGVRNYVKWLQGIYGEGHPPLGHRYIGSLVADFHRNLLSGGVYGYPGDLLNPDKPFGKMRLMVEAQPLAFIAKNAGGCASDGVGDILDIQPHDLHQRVPLFIGDCGLVNKVEEFIQEHDKEWLEKYTPFREGQIEHKT